MADSGEPPLAPLPLRRVVVRNVCLHAYHLDCLQRRMDEQNISRSEAIRQAIRDAEMGGRNLGAVPLARQILLAAQRLRRCFAGLPEARAAEAIEAIESAARQIIDG